MIKQKKISLFIPDLGGGGAERVFVNLANKLMELNFKIDLVVNTLNSAAYLDEINPRVCIVNLGAKRISFSLFRLISYLRSNNPEVLLTTRSHANCIAVLAKQMGNIRTRFIIRESVTLSWDKVNLTPLKRKIMNKFIKYCYPLADKVVAVSNDVKKDLVNNLKIPEDNIQVIYSPIITPDIFEKANMPLDHPWFQPGDPPVIMSAGRLTAQKRQDILIRAFAIARKSINLKLIILGEGELRANLEALVRKLDVESDVLMPGFMKNPFVFMNRSKLFILSSAWEGLPGVLIQALACGCPVISTDCPGGSREILQDGKLGKLVPVNDENALSQAIIEHFLKADKCNINTNELLPFCLEESVNEYLKVFQME